MILPLVNVSMSGICDFFCYSPWDLVAHYKVQACPARQSLWKVTIINKLKPWLQTVFFFRTKVTNGTLSRAHFKPKSGPYGRSLARFLEHEVTRSIATPPWMGCYWARHRVTPSSMSPVPIYTPGWRKTLWSKGSCVTRLKYVYKLTYIRPSKKVLKRTYQVGSNFNASRKYNNCQISRALIGS